MLVRLHISQTNRIEQKQVLDFFSAPTFLLDSYPQQKCIARTNYLDTQFKKTESTLFIPIGSQNIILTDYTITPPNVINTKALVFYSQNNLQAALETSKTFVAFWKVFKEKIRNLENAPAKNA